MSNFIVDSDRLRHVKKVERWRLGNERSEDALSWNLFVSLAQLGLLMTALTDFSDSSTPELYLWGNRIDGRSPEIWDRLKNAREQLEPGVGFPTEPDIIVRVPGRLLILIEAKFGSSNSTLEGKEDRYESIEEFLDRYGPAPGVADPLDRAWIEQQQAGHVLEQLCRNAIVATWLAHKGERIVVANLVRQDAEPDIEARFRLHLRPGSVEFRRLTWESFWPVLAAHGESAAPVRSYLSNKTMGLRQAFPSLPQLDSGRVVSSST